jgi:uncharacterized protein DUF5681
MSSDSDGHDEPPDDGPDKVGYGNPPKETRFKLGQVANPYGRPKGSKNRPHAASNDDLRKIILDDAYRDVTINDPNDRSPCPWQRRSFDQPTCPPYFIPGPHKRSVLQTGLLGLR